MSGLYSLSAWVTPFGLFESERRTESDLWAGDDVLLDLVVYAVVLTLDLLTLPLAVLYYAGVGRAEQ
ncbi:MAG: hypothetical protein ABEJ68_10595 [Halobacteriaceae archaeon]